MTLDAINLNQIATDVLEAAARKVIGDMIGNEARWALDNDLRELVRERAAQVLKEPEMESLLRQSLTAWIKDPKQNDPRR